MKRKLLPLAIGAAIAMPGVALAGPTVYGKVNVSLENADVDNGSDSADQWEVNSNASRLGVKGKEKISDNLSAVYKAEYEIAVDDGDAVFKQRNIYGGLKGGFGEVIVGNFDTPLKKAQKKVDLFNDLSPGTGDIKEILEEGENREPNLVQYTTPKMGAIVAKLAIQPGEDRDEGQDDPKDGLADGFSASVAFEQDDIYAALAHDSEIDGWDVTRLVAQAKVSGIQIGFLYQTGEESDGEEEQDAYVLSGAMKVGSDGKVKLQYGASELDNRDQDTSAETEERTQIGLGYEHKLSKQTKLYTHYISTETEIGSTTTENTNIAFGMEHKF